MHTIRKREEGDLNMMKEDIAGRISAKADRETAAEYRLDQQGIFDSADGLLLVLAGKGGSRCFVDFLSLTCDLVGEKGFINLDFEDIAAVIKDSGPAYINSVTVKGNSCEERLCKLNACDIVPKGVGATAKKCLIQIKGSTSIGLDDVEGVVKRVQEQLQPDVEIVFGAAFDDELVDELRVFVLMTGFEKINSL